METNFGEKRKEVRALFLQGKITYDEALDIMRPLVNQFNKKSIEIAKIYGVRPKKISVNGILR